MTREPIPADLESQSAPQPAANAPASQPASAQPAGSPAAKGTPVLAPLNGTFYRSDAPGKPQLAEDGAAVKPGQAVCVVEAMKLFNPIKAPAGGKIEFLVAHGAAVQKGQTLAVVS